MPMRMDTTAIVTTESQSAGEESSCLGDSVRMGSLEVVGWVSFGTEGDVTGGSVGFSAEGSLVAGWEGSVSGGILGSDVGGVAQESSFGIAFCSKAPQILQVRLARPSFSAVGELTVVHAP